MIALFSAVLAALWFFMFSAKSDFLEDKIVRWFFRAEAYTPPTTDYIALFTAAPGDSGGGTEVSGSAYARQGVVASPTGSARWAAPAATTGLTDNLDAINFPVATGSWGTVVAAAIFDASTAGNLLYYGNLTASKAVATGDQFKFNVGDLDVSEA